MLLRASILVVYGLSQPAVPIPNEAKGLHILWIPGAMSGLSTEPPGFKVQDPITQVDHTFSRAEDLRTILKTLPAQMKVNGIWISTSNSFLYVAEEKVELKALADLAGTLGIEVFICELGEQPRGWKKLGAP